MPSLPVTVTRGPGSTFERASTVTPGQDAAAAVGDFALNRAGLLGECGGRDEGERKK